MKNFNNSNNRDNKLLMKKLIILIKKRKNKLLISKLCKMLLIYLVLQIKNMLGKKIKIILKKYWKIKEKLNKRSFFP